MQQRAHPLTIAVVALMVAPFLVLAAQASAIAGVASIAAAITLAVLLARG